MRTIEVYRLTPLCKASYSDGMISEFQELSDKIDQLADMTMALRRENAELRQKNSALMEEAATCRLRQAEASRRIAALLEKIPSLETLAAEESAAEPVAEVAAEPAAEGAPAAAVALLVEETALQVQGEAQ